MYKNDKGETIIPLDVPQRDSKEGYIGTLLSLYLRFGSIIADANFRETDGRIYYMTRLMMSLIPDDERRAKTVEQIKADIAKAMKDCSNNEEKAKERNEVCLEYLGNIFAVVDEHLGISTEKRLGFVVDPERLKGIIQ